MGWQRVKFAVGWLFLRCVILKMCRIVYFSLFEDATENLDGRQKFIMLSTFLNLISKLLLGLLLIFALFLFLSSGLIMRLIVACRSE
jgi:hypothetical protein